MIFALRLSYERAQLGIAQVPEGRRVFAAMTVLENLEMGGYSARGRATLRQNIDRIFTLFPVLAEGRSQLAGALSGGEQQMLAIGRGIASSPRLLLLDVPSSVPPRRSEEIERSEVVKGYEYQRGQFVTFSTEELKALDVESSRVIDLEKFVIRSDVDPVHFTPRITSIPTAQLPLRRCG